MQGILLNTDMSETLHFGLTTADVKRKFGELMKKEGSVAAAITSLLNRDKFLRSKYRFRSLAQCEVWQEHIEAGRDALSTLSPVLQMLDTYVRFNRLESRSAALEELLYAANNEECASGRNSSSHDEAWNASEEANKATAHAVSSQTDGRSLAPSTATQTTATLLINRGTQTGSRRYPHVGAVHRASQTSYSTRDAAVQTEPCAKDSLLTSAVRSAATPWVFGGPIRSQGADGIGDEVSPCKNLRKKSNQPVSTKRKRLAPPLASSGNPILFESQCLPKASCQRNLHSEGHHVLPLASTATVVRSATGNVFFYRPPQPLATVQRNFPLRIPARFPPQQQNSITPNLLFSRHLAGSVAISYPMPSSNMPDRQTEDGRRPAPTGDVPNAGNVSSSIVTLSVPSKCPAVHNFNPDLVVGSAATQSAFVRVDRSRAENKKINLDSILYSKFETASDQDQDFPVPHFSESSGNATTSATEVASPSPASQEVMTARYGLPSQRGDAMTIENVPLRPSLKDDAVTTSQSCGQLSEEASSMRCKRSRKKTEFYRPEQQALHGYASASFP